MTTIPDYCTQNNGHCLSCSLANYGRDCRNFKIYNLGSLAAAITGGNVTAMAKILNDIGMTPRLNELEPDPGAFIPRLVLIDLAAVRTDRIGRKAAELLTA